MDKRSMILSLFLICFMAVVVPADEVCFAFASDIHVTTSGAGLAQISDSAAKRGARWLWAVGDLVEDGNSNSAWQIFVNAVNTSNIPIYCVPGNHDFSGRSWSDGPMKMTGWSIISKYLGCEFPRAEMLGNIPALLICTTWPGWDDYSEQVSWLAKNLTDYGDRNSPLLVINHFPPDENTQPLLNGDRPVLWFSGHTHTWLNKAAGGAWNLGSSAYSHGFWLITMDGGKVEAEKCDLNRWQFRAMARAQYPQFSLRRRINHEMLIGSLILRTGEK